VQISIHIYIFTRGGASQTPIFIFMSITKRISSVIIYVDANQKLRSLYFLAQIYCCFLRFVGHPILFQPYTARSAIIAYIKTLHIVVSMGFQRRSLQRVIAIGIIDFLLSAGDNLSGRPGQRRDQIYGGVYGPFDRVVIIILVMGSDVMLNNCASDSSTAWLNIRVRVCFVMAEIVNRKLRRISD